MIFRKVEMSRPQENVNGAPVIHGVMLNERMAKIGSTLHSTDDVFYDIADGSADESSMQHASSKIALDLDGDGIYDSKTQLMAVSDDGDVATMLLQQRAGRLKSQADLEVTLGGATTEMK